MTLPGIPDDYYIDGLLSEGGTAAVYRGINQRDGYEVAIKALFTSRAKDDFVLQRFREEANHYLYLKHSGITRLVDFIEAKDRFYLIMEFVDGVPLDRYLSTITGPMSEETLIPMFCKILDTIAYLHKNDIVHLDIKPNNIMVLNDKNIKILDMGISAIISDKNNNPKKCGTPAFMAPEQINLGDLGFYTDIFALGVTLFNMLTCQLPFSGNQTEVFKKICNEPTPQVADFIETANPQFQKIIERALQKEGKNRYQTCDEFKIEMSEILKKQENRKVNNNKIKLKKMKVVTVGRQQGNTIVISNDNLVSRKHLELERDDLDNFQIMDLDSVNGTFVNGRKLTSYEKMALSLTDIVRIGNTTLPWRSYFEEEAPTVVQQSSMKKGEKPPKPPINWRNVLSIVMTVFSLLFMIMMVLRMLGVFK
jgi:serine/threonine protein kinase